MTYSVFISAVSREFEAARDAIANDLAARGLTVKIQRSFRIEDDAPTTLDKLHKYISECDAVVALVGDYSGSYPPKDGIKPDYRAMLPDGMTRASYTQWEVIFALHYKRAITFAEAYDYQSERPASAEDDADAQRAWRTYLFDGHLGRDRIAFETKDYLRAEVLKKDWPQLKAAKPRNLPFSTIDTLFKGRDDLLKDIKQTFSAQTVGDGATVIVLHGLGGIGKTRAAVEYALQEDETYTALLFVVGKSQEELQAGLASLTGPAVLNLPEQDAANIEVRIAAVLRWLELNPGWLLLIDNADTENASLATEQLVARLRGGDVLITARVSEWSRAVHAKEINELSPKAAQELLLEDTDKRRVQADDPEKVALLAEKLGYLALALRQAAAFINQRRMSFEHYMQAWEEQSKKLLGPEAFRKNVVGYPLAVSITWNVTFKELSENARGLLDMLAFFSVEPIPTSLLDCLPEDVEDQDILHNALAELERYSFATRDADGFEFTIHRLVQQVTRDRLSDEERHEALGATIGWLNTATGPHNPQDVRTWPVLEPLLPHARSMFAVDTSITPPDGISSIFNQFGVMLLSSNRQLEAEPLFRRALKIDEASYGPDHPNVATRLNNLASLLRATNRLEEAEPLFRRALKIDEASYGPDHPEVATDLNNLASLLQDTNRLEEAEPLCRRALKIDEASYGPDHPEVATDLNNLAGLLRATNRLEEAEPLFRRALKIDEASYGPDHPEVATDLNNLASLLRATNRLEEAEPLFRRALKIDEASYGPDHPNVATHLNNLASLLRATNRLEEAEPLFRRALKIDEASYGPDHPNVATHLNNLASLLQDTNRLEEAEPLFRRALKIDEASYGPDHPNVATRLNNLASLLQDTNRLEEAEPLFRRALKIDEASYGPDHPNVATRLNNLASLLRATNRLEEAEPLFRRALKIDEASYGPDHPNVATHLNNLAGLLRATNRLEEAEPLFRRALSILLLFTARTGHGHPNLQAAINNYIGILIELGNEELSIRQTINTMFEEAGLAPPNWESQDQ